MSANVRNASGTVVLAADDARAAWAQNATRASVSAQFPVTGLTPGATYTATPAYRSGNTGNTAHFDNRFIRVDPIP
ncbi:hypothetical protein [Streptomyces sp.]|uniref:hypothetical protein n=1 Tax=Streptomyces sp. TaxID=1931 RepID=UPI002F42C273